MPQMWPDCMLIKFEFERFVTPATFSLGVISEIWYGNSLLMDTNAPTILPDTYNNLRTRYMFTCITGEAIKIDINIRPSPGSYPYVFDMNFGPYKGGSFPPVTNQMADVQLKNWVTRQYAIEDNTTLGINFRYKRYVTTHEVLGVDEQAVKDNDVYWQDNAAAPALPVEYWSWFMQGTQRYPAAATSMGFDYHVKCTMYTRMFQRVAGNIANPLKTYARYQIDEKGMKKPWDEVKVSPVHNIVDEFAKMDTEYRPREEMSKSFIATPKFTKK